MAQRYAGVAMSRRALTCALFALVFALGSAGCKHSSAKAAPDAAASVAAVHAPVPMTPPPENCPPGMIGIPGGGYRPAGDAKRDVKLAPFCLDKTKVTVSAYKECVDAGHCTEPDTGVYCNWKHKKEERSDHPVNCIDWNQATNFCKRRGARLPTEEEWEWAARSGDKAWTYPWGNAAPDQTRLNVCGYECPKGPSGWWGFHWEDDFKETAPVGSFPKGANRWGVLDLQGNLEEWTSSKYQPWWDAGPSDPDRYVYRGSDFRCRISTNLLLTSRGGAKPADRFFDRGFRCARSP